MLVQLFNAPTKHNQLEHIVLCMEEHVHSYKRISERKERTPTTPLIKAQATTQHIHTTTHKKKREAGPWVPSLENWNGRLRSLLQAQLTLHTQCPNISYIKKY